MAPRPPPSCLAAFDARLETSAVEEDGDVSFDRYTVSCPCGGAVFRVLGFPDEHEPRGVLDGLRRTLLRVLLEARAGLGERRKGGLCAPIHLACEACGHEAVAFDPDRDGPPRRAQGDDPPPARRSGIEAVRCRLCRRAGHRVVVSLGARPPPLALSPPATEPPGPDDADAARFDIFRLDATCDTCSNAARVAEIEVDRAPR